MENKVLNALKNVNDPDLHKDLVSLNMIRNIKIEGKQIGFDVVLTTPACPLKEKIKGDCIEALLAEFGPSFEFKINMTSDVTTQRHNANVLPGVKNIIAVSSGKGGVGKSTVTSNLALALSLMGAKVGLVDADIFGPSTPTMFGAAFERPEITEIDGKNTLIPIEKYGVKLMSIGFLVEPDAAMIWRGPMASSALKQFFADTQWGELDYMLIDLPPGTSDIHLTMVQSVPVTGVVIVTTPQVVALSDVIKSIQMYRQPQINVPIIGLVENMAWFTPAELPNNKYYIFGKDGGAKLAQRFGIELLGQIPLVQSIREGGDDGRPAVIDEESAVGKAFMALAENVARNIAIRNANLDKTKVVEITQ